MSLLVDNEKVKRQLRLLVGAGTGSEDADIAAYALAGWLDESLGLLAEAKGALLIEDGEDAARGRIMAELLEAFGVADEGLQVISSGRFGFRPEREWVLSLAAKVLRAAVGEGEDDG